MSQQILRFHTHGIRRVVIVACACLFPSVALGQHAQLSGVIRDAQTAAIANADVRLTEESTGIELDTRSNKNGTYLFASVRPGTYRLDAVANGFAKVVHADVTLHVDQRAVLDVTLPVAGVALETTVTAATPLLGKADGSLGTVIDRNLTDSMPLRGRAFSSLLALVPGVVSAGPVNDAADFRVNGQRQSSNTLLVDGVSAASEMGSSGFNDAGGQRFSTTVTGAINGGLSIDAIQEIHIQTSSFAAEFGRTPGALISLVTRSGTNRLQGSGVFQFRNDKMSANDWFANRSHTPKPRSEERQFGTAVGGPLVRNRVFFFATYEGLRLDRPTFLQQFVPSMEARQQAAVTTRRAIEQYPLPTGPARADGAAELTGYFPLNYNSDTWGVRLDYARPQMQIFGRYSSTPSVREDGGPFAGDARLSTGAQNVTVGLTRTLGTATLMEARANYNRAEYQARTERALKEFFPDSLPDTAQLEFGAAGLATLATGNRGNNGQRSSNVIASLSHGRGTHQIKVGVDYRRLWPGVEDRYSLILRFPNLSQALLGSGATTSVSSRPGTHATFQNTSAYAQDSWRPRPRLSITYGLRWDINPAPDYHDGEGPISVTTFEPISALKMTSRRNVPLWKTDYTGFFPRLGVSYALDTDARTVLSGGVGLFGDLAATAAGVATTFAAGVQTVINSSNVTLPLTPSLVNAPLTPNITPPYTGNIYVVDPDLDTPRTLQWNVTLQRRLGSGHEVAVSAVGADGEDLLQQTRYPPGSSPDFASDVFTISNGGRSRYRSLQTRYRGRLFQGFETLSSYTLAETIETEARLNSGSKSLALSPSSSDVRHVFNAAVTWTLPGIGSRPLAHVTNGWTLGLLASFRSGYPFSIRSSSFTAIAGQELLPERFASIVPGVPVVLDDHNAPGGRRFNRAAFTNPPAGEQGNAKPNAFRGFGARQFDVSLQRSVPLVGRSKAQVRIDVFNALNTPTFAQPISDINNANFGVPTQMRTTSLASLYRAGGPRTIAVSLRVEY